MKLLVDIGNSRTKWVKLTTDGLVGATTIDNRSYDQIPQMLQGEVPEVVYVATVSGRNINDGFVGLCQRVWGIEPVLMHAQAECCGVRNGYIQPEKLGIDRWAALIAAYRAVSGTVIVVDCGTAMTIDVVDQHGIHLGGLIVPGLRMMKECLISGTAQVRPDGANSLQDGLGRNTASCLHQGAESALVGTIEHIYREMTSRLGDVTIVLTGGDASALLPHIPFNVRYEQQLVLQGIASIVESGGANERQ